MTLRHLRIFTAVCQCGSATEAALNNKIKIPYSFAHSLPAEEEEQERSIFL